MFATYLQRGVASGLVAGLGYAAYMIFVGNPLTEYVHDAGHDHAGHDHAGHAHESTHAVSEATTAIVSAGSAVLWAIFLGGVFAVALYLFEPALPGPDASKPYVLAAAGFLTVSAVPWLVLPPAAPGAEHGYGIDARLGLYVGLVAVGAITVAVAVVAYNHNARHGVGLGIASGALPILAAVGLLALAAPTVTTHPDLSAELVTAYQGLAALSQAALWLLIAATFAGLRRRGTPRSKRVSRRSDGALSD